MWITTASYGRCNQDHSESKLHISSPEVDIWDKIKSGGNQKIAHSSNHHHFTTQKNYITGLWQVQYQLISIYKMYTYSWTQIMKTLFSFWIHVYVVFLDKRCDEITIYDSFKHL